jgi:glycosyltransferase involved in cell wall biosynthesis
VRAILAEESGNRRRLHQLRDSPGYESAWDEPRPLVSVTIATVGRPELLRTRSLPSVLGQTYRDLEVVVVGDAAGAETEEAAASFGDERVRYSNLSRRENLPDRRHRWLVGSTHARNEAMRLARGQWVMAFDDDDELHPDAVERLLALARRERAEVAYGRFRGHWSDQVLEAGEFPPRRGEFSWGPAIYHAGLRFLTREFAAGYLDAPGDWYLAERMLRIGVRFAMLDEIVLEVYPSEHSYATGDGVWPGRAQAR